MSEERTASALLAAGDDDIDKSIAALAGRKGDRIAITNMLGAEFFGIKGRTRIAVIVHHSIAALIFCSHPVHLRIHVLPHQLQQSGGIKGGRKDGVIESLAHGLRVIRMAIQLTTDVEHLAAFKHLPDDAGTISILPDHPHHQPAKRRAVGRGIVLAMLAPISVEVPVQKSDQLVIDLVQKSPYPVHPKWLKSFNRWTADQRPAASQVRFEPAQAALGDLLIDVPILSEGDRSANPLVVRLVPDAPIPVAYDISAPLLNATANDIATAVGEFLDGRQIIHWLMHLGK